MVVADVLGPKDCPLHKHWQGAPANQYNGHLQEIPLAVEISPFQSLHQFSL